jgi:tRNA pseudouridine55 synthase
MEGLLLIDKPAGPTSRAVLDSVRRVLELGPRDFGHAGTLDPQATGLLVLALGGATRWLPYLPGGKCYRATVRLGLATDSEDIWGLPTLSESVAAPDPEAFKAALESLCDLREQVVPMVSAVKHEGRRLYELAREGVSVERAARPVRVHAVRVLAVRGLEADFEVDCGPGTYVRSLCVEAGRRLGLPACMAGLRRLAANGFSVRAALPQERWTPGELREALLGSGEALGHLPERELNLDEADAVRHGRALGLGAGAAGADRGVWRLTLGGRLLALAEAVSQDGGLLRPKRVFAV